MLPGSILIIDDEEKLRNLFGRIIRAEGFEVFEAADCKTGLKRLEHSSETFRSENILGSKSENRSS